MPRPRDGAHARIYRKWLELPAWRTLGTFARVLITELHARYRPMEPNQFEISELTASKLIGCARNTAVKALAQLEDRGWITVVRVGRMFGNKATRASVYALTTYPTDDGKPASKAFLIWEPHPIQRLKIRPPTAQNITVNGSIQSQPRDIFREENHPVKH